MTKPTQIDEFYNKYPEAPNPEHYPKAFEHYAKMFMYQKFQKERKKADAEILKV